MMKHTLEKLLELGRGFFRESEVCVGTNRISIAVDNKILLMSNYVSQRVFELSGKQLEISFMYGGNVQRRLGQTNIIVDSFHMPHKQHIHEGSFDSTADTTYEANRYFADQKKRLVAIGHSHASFDVFHSATDIDNYKRLVGTIGIKVEHPTNALVQVARTFMTYSRRARRQFSYEKSVEKKSTFSYVLPSFVFNASGKYVDTVIAAKSYASEKNQPQQLKTYFAMHDCHIKVFNKQAILTHDEKKTLDFAIQKVLSYNGLLR